MYKVYNDTNYKVVAERTRNYYKYSSWTQPTLTSNGTLGVSAFATLGTTSYDAVPQNTYLAFSPNTGTVYTYLSLKVSTFYLFFAAKNPLLITKLSFYIPMNGTQNNYNGGWGQDFYLYGLTMEGTWKQLYYLAGGANMAKVTHTLDLSSNTTPCTMFRLQGTTKGAGHNDELEISQIQITAKQAIAGTEQNHDFYVDTYSYKTYEGD